MYVREKIPRVYNLQKYKKGFRKHIFVYTNADN